MKNNLFAYRRIPDSVETSTVKADINKQKQIQTNLKHIFLIVRFILNVLFYGVFVNLASTKWYFLKQANMEKEKAESSYNITKFNINEYQRIIRDQIPNSRDRRILNIESDVAMK